MLLIGYGNPGRGDDGLGPALSEGMAARGLPGWDIDTDYQLSAEHALAISTHDVVVFADAELDLDEPFSFREIEPGSPEYLGSHSLQPSTVLALCQMLYGARPRAFVLGISGKEFGEVSEGLSDTAAHNLDKARTFFLTWVGSLAPASLT